MANDLGFSYNPANGTLDVGLQQDLSIYVVPISGTPVIQEQLTVISLVNTNGDSYLVYDGSLGGYQRGFSGTVSNYNGDGKAWNFSFEKPWLDNLTYTISISTYDDLGDPFADSSQFTTLTLAAISLTPITHQVFNEFDRHGLLLNVTRLPGEKNAEYKQRLLDSRTHIANSSYMGLIYGITRELGLTLSEAIKVTMAKNPDGTFVESNPVFLIEERYIKLFKNYSTGTADIIIDVTDPTGGGYTIQQVVDTINTTSYMSASLLDSSLGDLRAEHMYHQSTLIEVLFEPIGEKGALVNLENSNLIDGTVVVSSTNLTRRVDSQVALRRHGDFYLDLQAGTIYSYSATGATDVVRYQAVRETTTIKSSPVIIHDTQSNNFRERLFEKIYASGEAEGLPTKLGADIINELMTVFPSGWGR